MRQRTDLQVASNASGRRPEAGAGRNTAP